jgi:hypothetical protein
LADAGYSEMFINSPTAATLGRKTQHCPCRRGSHSGHCPRDQKQLFPDDDGLDGPGAANAPEPNEVAQAILEGVRVGIVDLSSC